MLVKGCQEPTIRRNAEYDEEHEQAGSRLIELKRWASDERSQ